MSLKKLFALAFCLLIIQGCTMFENGYSSNYSEEQSYDYNYNEEEELQTPDNVRTSRRKAELDNEMPVQMTKQDDKLESLSPEIKQPAVKQSNKKVLLPISGTIE